MVNTLEDIFKELNPSQKEAVLCTEGPLLVFAGAGSGKTRVITYRIAYMIQEKKIPASQIVALSFTNKSAREMKNRLQSMVPKNKLRGIVLSTFHSLGLKILRQHISYLGYTKEFCILNYEDLVDIIIGILKSRKLDPKEFLPKEILTRISKLKNLGFLDQSFPIQHKEDNPTQELSLEIFSEYQKILKERNSVDLDDLILLPLQLLKNYPEVATYYHSKYKYFLVDEFQDTNFMQYEFLTYLRGNSNHLCVVGDDDQSIYAFRGSQVGLILNFENDFPESKVVRLLENYRSTEKIIKGANSLIQNNPTRKQKDLYSNIQSNEFIEYYELEDEREEAAFVANWIESIYRKGFPLQEVAVLFRTNYQSRPLEEEFRMRNIPYKVVGGYNFFDRKEIRDIISYLRVIANPKDDSSILRTLNTPKRGIGSASIAIIYGEAAKNQEPIYTVLEKIVQDPDYLREIKPKVRHEIYVFIEFIERFKKEFFYSSKLAPVLKKLIQESGIEAEIYKEEENEKVRNAKIANCYELVNMLSYYEEDEDLEEEKKDIYGFLGRLALLMDDGDKEEEEEKKKGRVQLLTIHQSKGLEYHTVFVVGLEEGILPNHKMMDAGGIEEERRLFYVAMTRAKRKLLLTGCKSRKKYGENIFSEPSRFIHEIDESTIQKYFLENNTTVPFENLLEELEKLKAG